MDSIANIRSQFSDKLAAKEFVGNTIEIIGTSFIADHETIFGKPNEDYVRRELDWYLSLSRRVDDIPGGAPKIWKQIASDDGLINSNYGYLLISNENGGQLAHVVSELIQNPGSRRATAIYTRPSIHNEWNTNGMADFICTNAVQYLIRDGRLDVVVQMRSNDAIFGYRNDYAWQKYVQRVILAMLKDEGLEIKPGNIIWNAASLHIYERHFHLVQKFMLTGKFDTDL